MLIISLVPSTFNLENGGMRLADNGSPVSILDTLTLLNNCFYNSISITFLRAFVDGRP